MKRDRLRVVPECHRHVVNGVSILEKSTRKCVAEAVRSRLLFEGAGGFERVSKTRAPDVGDRLKAF
jgi:hypothetical protein